MVRACQVQPYTKMEAVGIPRTRLQQVLFMKSHLADNAFSVFVDCFTTLLCGNVHILQNVGRFFNKLFETETLAIHNCVRLIFAWRLNVALDVFSTSTSASIMDSFAYCHAVDCLIYFFKRMHESFVHILFFLVKFS